MVNLGCIFCHSEIDSDSMEDINTRYERHLTEWHRISDESERKSTMTRTILKLVENNNNLSESCNNLDNKNDETLSNTIDKALKAGNCNKNQITFENDDFVVSASFLGDFSQEDISSNPDATSVEGRGCDFDDNSGGTHLLSTRNIEHEDISTLPIDETHISRNDDENVEQLFIVNGDIMNTDISHDILIQKDGSVHKDISAAIDEKNGSVNISISKPDDTLKSLLLEVNIGDVNDENEAENVPGANSSLEKELLGNVMQNPLYSDSSSNASEQLNDDEGTITDSLVVDNDLYEDGGKASMEDFDNCHERKECGSISSSEEKVIRRCSVEVAKLSEREVGDKIAVDEVRVPWYEWGYHTCVMCRSSIFLGSVERHLRLHNLSIEEYLAEHHIQEIKLFIPPYKCLVCDKPVPHSNKAISAHIKVHGLDMGTYYFHYVSDDAKPDVSESINEKEENENCDVTQRVTEVTETNSCSKSGTKRKSAIESADTMSKRARSRSSTESDTLPWYEGSWHRCLECGDVTTKGRFFVSHVKVGHKMSRKEYMEKYPEDDVTTDDWKCEMCGKGVSWSVRSIAAHLAKAHSITKEEYASRYIEIHSNKIEEMNHDAKAKAGNQQLLSKATVEDGLGTSQDLLVVFDKYS